MACAVLSSNHVTSTGLVSSSERGVGHLEALGNALGRWLVPLIALGGMGTKRKTHFLATRQICNVTEYRTRAGVYRQ
jgi:hypothetical protein